MFFGILLSYFLMIGGALMAVGLSVNAIWRAIMPPSGLPRDGAACGSCGYELVTLSQGRCSECGADLLKSGVNTRHTMVRTAGSLPAAVMGWSIIMIMLSGIAFMIGVAVTAMNGTGMGNAPQTITTTQSFRPERFDNDGDGVRTRSADYGFTIVFDGEYDWSLGNSVVSGTVSIEVEGDDVTTPLTLLYDVESEDYTVTASDGTLLDSGTGYSEQDAATLLATAGLDTADAGLAVEAEQVGELFQGVLDDPQSYEMVVLSGVGSSVGGVSNTNGSTNYGTGGMGNPFSSSSTEMMVAGGILLLSLLIYAAGLVFIVRRRGRIISRPRAAAA